MIFIVSIDRAFPNRSIEDMTQPVYSPSRTGLLLVDPYNDFLSEGGKLFPLLKNV